MFDGFFNELFLKSIDLFFDWLTRYLVVSGDMDFSTQTSTLERFEVDPRYSLLILAGVQSFAGLQLPKGKLGRRIDWLIDRGLVIT